MGVGWGINDDEVGAGCVCVWWWCINDYMVNMGPAEGRGMMAAERDRHTTLLTKKCF